jgi:hypothetical protein
MRQSVASGGRAQFCFDRPGEDLAKLYLIISNTAPGPSLTVAGWLRVRPVAAPCGTYAVHSRYTEYVGGQVALSIAVMGEIDLSRDPLDNPTPTTLTYTIVFGSEGPAGGGTASNGRSQVAQIGGLTAAAAPGAPGGSACAPRTRLRYTGRTTVTINFVQGGPFELNVDSELAHELVAGLFSWLDKEFGVFGAMAIMPFLLLITLAPLLMDLAQFQLAFLAEQSFGRSRRTDCGLATSRRSRTVVQIPGR